MVQRREIVIVLAASMMVLFLSLSSAYAETGRKPDLTDVTGIRFEPLEPIELEELVDGFIDCEDYVFTYKWDNKLFSKGNALILINKDGSESRFVYNGKRRFISKDGYEIPIYDIQASSSDGHYEDVCKLRRFENKEVVRAWPAGTHIVTLCYKGLSCEVPVTVVNTIENVEYIQHNNKFIEHYGGDWYTDTNGEKYYYYDYGFADKDKIRITWKDGTVKDYIYRIGTEDPDDDDLLQFPFVCKDGTKIHLYFFYLDDDEGVNHWVKGGDNYIIFYYAGREVKSPVQIVDSPIDSVSFKPKKPVVYMENINIDSYYDVAGLIHYEYGAPVFREGDKLTVVKKGKKKSYLYSWRKKCFINGKDCIQGNDVQISTYQEYKPWTLGSDNQFEVNYLGRTCTVNVTVQKDSVPNPFIAKNSTIKIKYPALRKATKKIYSEKAYKIYNVPLWSMKYKCVKIDRKAKSKIKVDKNGTIIVKKGLKKGKYKIKIKLTALGSKNLGYNTASKRVTVAVNVK